MRPTRRLPALLAGGVAVALLAGCTGPAEQAKAKPAPSPSGPAPTALVRAAAVETDEQSSARYSLMTTTKVNGTDVVLSGVGVLDWAADKGETTYDVPGGQVNQRLLGKRLFLALPQQPGIFFELKTADVAASPVGGMVDPTAQLHLLAAVSDAEVVGKEEVRGEETTHYRGTYDVARAIRGTADPQQQAALKSLLGAGARMAQAPYDVFLDDDGRLRRLKQTIEVPASDATGGQKLSVETTLEFYEFGVEVIVKGPPGATIRDGAPILAALRKALPQPTASASPPAKPASPAAKPVPTPSK